MKGISQSCAKILFVTSCTSQIVVKKKNFMLNQTLKFGIMMNIVDFD